MNEKLKPLLSLIAIACGLIFIVLIAASFVISSTEEPEEIDLTETEGMSLYPIILILSISGVVIIILLVFKYWDIFVSNRSSDK